MPGRRRLAGRLTAPAAVAVLLAGLPPTSFGAARAAGDDPDLCDRASAGAVAGHLAEPALTELSGLAASPTHDGVLWAHNDSGGAPALHALAPDGTALGTFPIAGAEAVDWEDMAVGPGPDPTRPLLYVGDIGDNDAVRDSVTIYRAAEPQARPDGVGVALALVDATAVRYPNGPADVEALLVDPDTGDVLLITKSYAGASRVLRVDQGDLGQAGVVTAEDVGGLRVPLVAAFGGGLPGTAVTGADAAPDGSVVLVRTYQSVLALARPPGGTLVDAFSSEPCEAPQLAEDQGEAIAFTRAGDAYLTIGEGPGTPVHRFPLAPPEVPTTTTAEGLDPPAVGAAEEDDRAVAVIVIGAVAVIAAVVLLGARLRRRRDRAA